MQDLTPGSAPKVRTVGGSGLSRPQRRNGPRAVSYEGDGEVGRDEYRRPPRLLAPPFEGKRGAPAGAPRSRVRLSLRSGIRVRAAEDVGVAESRRAVLLRRGAVRVG